MINNTYHALKLKEIRKIMNQQNKGNDTIPMGKAIAIILTVFFGGAALIGGLFFFALSGGTNNPRTSTASMSTPQDSNSNKHRGLIIV